jgi:DNA-binding response OmpR family regulator
MNLFGKRKKEDSKNKGDLSAKEKPIPAANDGQPSEGKRKILIVDDDEVVVMALTLKLQASGYQVVSATDGAAAVSLVRHEEPDLVILDVNFPPEVGMSWDGFKIMEWFRGRGGEAGAFPVIIITGEDSPRNKGRAATVGAAAFFQKPINTEELLVTIREILA